MTQPDKMTIEECEYFAERHDTEADIYKQLADTMRENENLLKQMNSHFPICHTCNQRFVPINPENHNPNKDSE